MLDLKRIRTETDRVRQAIAYKKTQADLDRYLLLDEQRRALLAEAERLKHERNAVSEEIGGLKRAGKDAPDKVAAMKRVGEEIKALDARIVDLESELEKILIWIPNVPHSSVPRAGDAAGNVVVRESGRIREPGFKPKAHWELAQSLGLLDRGFQCFVGDNPVEADEVIESVKPFEARVSALRESIGGLKGRQAVALAYVLESIERTGAYATDIAELAINNSLAEK